MSNTLPIQQVAPDFCVAPQLAPAAMAEAAAAGFRSVVNNRPDFEHGPDQPTSAEIAAAAPNSGQVRPNTIGSLICCRASVGRKVAGMM